MSRPQLSLQLLGKTRYFDQGPRPRGVHLFYAGKKSDCHPGLFEESQIGLFRSGVPSQIFTGSKLKGVYEDAHDHLICPLLGFFNKTQVPSMQSPHRGNKTSLPTRDLF
jgi:hypothetical protein